MPTIWIPNQAAASDFPPSPSVLRAHPRTSNRGPRGLPTSPGQRHTEDPVLEMSTLEPELSYLLTLCGVHHHIIEIRHPGMRQGNNSLGSKKASTFRPQLQLRRQSVAGETPGSTGEVKKSSVDRLRADAVLRSRCIPCLGPCRQCRHPVTS